MVAFRPNTANATRACCAIFFVSSGKPPFACGNRDALTTKLYASSSMSSTCAKPTHQPASERADKERNPADSTSSKPAGRLRHHRYLCCPFLRKADSDNVEQFFIVHRLLKKCRCSCPQRARLVAPRI